jgi:hypothetical protein
MGDAQVKELDLSGAELTLQDLDLGVCLCGCVFFVLFFLFFFFF